VKRNRRVSGVKVSADGAGVVSHAGVGMLREMADYTGLTDSISKELLDTYRGVPGHAPGRVFADLAVAVADRADAIAHSEKENAAATWKKLVTLVLVPARAMRLRDNECCFHDRVES
jgi:hypothetical protein